MPNFTDEKLEDLVYYQDNETENYNSDSDDDLGEDLILEMDKTDMIQNIKFTKETKRILTREISVVGDHMRLYRKKCRNIFSSNFLF